MFLDQPPVHPYASFWLDVADKGIKALAVFVAGIWTYATVARSRTYRRKLESSLSGEIFKRGTDHYLLVSCRLKNVGQSIYTITQRGTAVSSYTLAASGRTHLYTTPVFQEHRAVEPGEQIDDPLVLPIPDPATFVALRLELRVISVKSEWNTSCVVKE